MTISPLHNWSYLIPNDLKAIPYPSDQAIQPAWIGDQFPAYAHDHGMQQELSSVRHAEHKGHKITITTTYHIEIDGKSVHIHAAVGNDGRLHCHSTPYDYYQSAVDLVTTLIDRFPDAFLPNSAEGGTHDSPQHS